MDSNYKRLRDKWYKKLEKSGFNDVEIVDRDFLKEYDSLRFSKLNSEVVDAKRTYYQCASNYLHLGELKGRKLKIWELHCQGLTVREISRRLKCPIMTIQDDIQRMRTRMKKLKIL